ncbi:uncharacterized protein CXorf38-like [Megalops cyprinoides]|uniref:uncharacterized protein CXorf38-like n=1 Tax=Megalops cyprinoides TaxID=118141 RepID=UPI001863A309|nr:uncharacterized protein CXorf38-like [Megalops cyprinoides]
MVHEELSARLNEVGYKNWLKAGYCLLKLKDGLHGYINNEMKSFHGIIISSNDVLQRQQQCRNNCRPNGNHLHSLCWLCEEWKREILRHHTNRTGVVNWGNCKPWLWPSQHWELAKAYMPRGQSNITGADQCDAAALLNLISFCDHFSFIDQRQVREVIRQRNELMHSSEMRVSAQWMLQYQKSLDRLLQQLQHVPEVAAARREIKEMLSVDWTICVPGADSVDGPEWTGLEPTLVSQVEAELLREKLQELLLYTEAQTPVGLHAQDLSELQNLQVFLRGQRDLEEQFHAELQTVRLQLQQAGIQDRGELQN